MTRSLDNWRSVLLSTDHCPWPGPVPLGEHDARNLVGRDEAIGRFAYDVISHRLVVLTGDSGVGKTSVLWAGLVPALRASGFQPLVCDEWSPPSSDTGAPADVGAMSRFLMGKLQDAGRLPPGLDPQADDLRQKLSEIGTSVLILDQFEELIRYQPELFVRVRDWVIDTNVRYPSVRVVLSLRAEYEHKLREIEVQARPFSVTRTFLEPLGDAESVSEIIGRPVDGVSVSLQEGVKARLEAAWSAARREHASGTGLLHLQATLYACHAAAVAAGRTAILHEDVNAVFDSTGNDLADNPQAAALAYSSALTRAVQVKLNRCVAACDDASTGIDQYLKQGTRALAERIVPHLASGGFKIVHERWDLTQLVLASDLSRLVDGARLSSGSGPNQLVADVYRSLSAHGELDFSRSWGEVIGWSPQPDPVQHVGLRVAPWVADPDDVTSGPMSGLPTEGVIVEELTRFLFAIEWLVTSRLVRQSSLGTQTWLSLIHDGFGSGLAHWAEGSVGSPDRWLHSLVGASGERFAWGNRYVDELCGSEDKHRHVMNVRWRDCLIRANFKNVVFANCDFRGTRFDGCSFEGVVFVNCLLDGAVIGDSTILGSVPSYEAPSGEGNLFPSFDIGEPSANEMAALQRYRSGEDWSALVSLTSGIPVIPRPAWLPNPRVLLLEVHSHFGGLAMYGGRLSSLMIRNCRFESSRTGAGRLALRHVAGASLDVVEQDHAAIEIVASTIRGLTISRPVEATATASNGRVLLNVRSTALANTWIGNYVSGQIDIDDCKVWQLWNTSDSTSLDVSIRRSQVHGLVNVGRDAIKDLGLEDGSGFAPDVSTDGLAYNKVFELSRRMDYRSTPARLELLELAKQLGAS